MMKKMTRMKSVTNNKEDNVLTAKICMLEIASSDCGDIRDSESQWVSSEANPSLNAQLITPSQRRLFDMQEYERYSEHCSTS